MSGRLFLVGPMGAGKTTIGRQLARTLHSNFVDSDQEIETRTGVDIPLIFELEGEAGFRSRERDIINELTQQKSIVLATGGGAILSPVNRSRFKERGTVIYLETSVDQQLARTSRDRHRPLLQTEDPREKLEQLMTQREPLYLEVADLIASTNNCTVKDVVHNILQQLKEDDICYNPKN